MLRDIEVRVRYASESLSRHLGTCDADDVERLPSILMRWGIPAELDVVHQFDVDNACVELVVMDND